jgi:hypothetical protein
MPSAVGMTPLIFNDPVGWTDSVKSSIPIQRRVNAYPRFMGTSIDYSTITGKSGHSLGMGELEYELGRIDPIGRKDSVFVPMINPFSKDWDPSVLVGEGEMAYSRESMASYIHKINKRLSYSGINLLAYCYGFSNPVWALEATASKTGDTQKVFFPAANDAVTQTVVKTVVAGDSITGAVVLIGNGTIHLRIGEPSHTDFSEVQMTLDSITPTFWSLTHTFAGGFTDVSLSIFLKAGDTATEVSMVLFNPWYRTVQLNDGLKVCDFILNPDATLLYPTPRVEDYPSLRFEVGVKSEAPSENLWTYSEQLDNGAYTQINCTVTANQEWSPEAFPLQTMDKIIESNDPVTPVIHELDRNITVVAGGPVCFSGFFKQGTRRYARLEIYNAVDGILAYGHFDLQTGTLVASGGANPIHVGVENRFPDFPSSRPDAFRLYCSTQFLTGTETVYTAKIILMDTSTTFTYLGNGINAIFAWGLQAEEKIYPSSYIPTLQNTYVRDVDVLEYIPDGADIPDADAEDYSFLIEGGVSHLRGDGTTDQTLVRFNNVDTRRLVASDLAGGDSFVQHDVGGSVTFGESMSSRKPKTFLATKNASLLQAWLNGQLSASAAPAALSGTLTSIRFGYWGTEGLDGWVRGFRYFTKELTFAGDSDGLLIGGESTYYFITRDYDLVDGWLDESFTDLYYNQIHIIPNPLDVGNLLSGAVRTVEVWNAYFTDKLLSSINGADVEGIAISDGITPPDTFGALESTTYTLTISQNGPAVIRGQYEFVFPDSSPILLIIGNRTIPFDFPYDRGATEGLEWKTDVIPAIEGEQTRKLRYAPRQTVRVDYALLADEQSLADSRLYGWSDKVFLVPLLWEAQIVQAHLTGATTIYCNPAIARFVVDGTALLYIDRDRRQDVEIDSIGVDHIVIKVALTQDFTGGSILLIPTRTAYLASKPTKNRMDGDYAKYAINWRMIENYPPAAFSGGPVYQGFDVLEEPIISDSAVGESIYKAVEWIDNSIGEFKPYPIKTFTTETRKINWHVDGLVQLMNLYKWLGNRSGRYQPFWYPSFRGDFTVVNTIGITDTVVQVYDNQYMLYEDGTTRHVALWLRSGVKYYRQVTAIENDQVNIDTAFGVEIEPEDIMFFGWLHFLRFNTDQVTLQHDGQWSNTSIPLVTIV